MSARARIRLELRGRVQGVGFRPFAWRLARELGLGGWVRNSGQGATVEVEGAEEAVAAFAARLRAELPGPGAVWSAEQRALPPRGETEMRIAASEAGEALASVVPPDLALCAECRHELFTPGGRRYGYPFLSCAQCGPRYSIALGLPYDRDRTTMLRFPLCPACLAEYENPADRRFHAQATACPDCGPRLAFWTREGALLDVGATALQASVQAIARGEIVAVKGLGGFQLLVDARNAEAVGRLRARKRRPAKPFAVMFPSLAALRADAEADEAEAEWLEGIAAPIVLLRRKKEAGLAEAVAPGNPLVGAMLPYTPLHALLLAALDAPVVATSGNLSGEPICIDEREALVRLGEIADRFLVHDRPIARPVDDSVVRMMGGRSVVLRRARGHAPLPLPFPRAAAAPPVLALGGHLKSAVAVTLGGEVVLGAHIGDLDTALAVEAFARAVDDTERLFGVRPARIAHDAHPDYRSTQAARERGGPAHAVFHHHAHVLACALDHGLEGPVLGVAWDGTGYGPDGTIWGGEFLRVDGASAGRVAHLRTFRLPGGEAAAREPRRSALGALTEALGELAFARADLAPVAAFAARERDLLRQAVARGVNAPLTSSAGRLFDAVAALAGLAQRVSFEAEAAMALEFAAERAAGPVVPYPIDIGADGVVDWVPTLRAVLADIEARRPVESVAARFHEALVDAIVEVARRHAPLPVLLTGGCFQNRYLLERAIARLLEAGLRPFWHERVPPNDGGLAAGQAAAAMWMETSHAPDRRRDGEPGEAACASLFPDGSRKSAATIR